MSLKTRFWTSSIAVLGITVSVTLCLSTLFGIVYAQLYKVPTAFNTNMQLIVLCDDELLYASKGLSKVYVNEVIMNLDMNRPVIEQNDISYRISSEQFNSTDGQQYVIVKLAPISNNDAYYNTLMGFSACVFVLTFLVAGFIAQRYYKVSIIDPALRLKIETERLSEGDLDTPIELKGEGEIGQLSTSVEQLRLRLKEAVYQQKHYDENRSFLVSSMSHDLKTPVTAVRGYIEGVLDGVADTKEKQTRYLHAALEKTRLIHTMIDDLLYYSRLDMHQVPFDLERVCIQTYLADCVQDNLLYFEHDGKKITLQDQTSGSLYVQIDEMRFKRVVQNILDNAKKHIKTGTGSVTVLLRETSSSAVIEFRDNGEGIRREDLPHIFDRFYRADSARRAEGSSGLGLAIAKQIVEGLGGRIWAVSEEGGGTSIMISLRKVSA